MAVTSFQKQGIAFLETIQILYKILQPSLMICKAKLELRLTRNYKQFFLKLKAFKLFVIHISKILKREEEKRK